MGKLGELRTLGPEGDVKATWDPDVEAEVSEARHVFDTLRAKGYFAYKVRDGGKKGRVIDEFEPAAERIIMAPPMAGG